MVRKIQFEFVLQLCVVSMLSGAQSGFAQSVTRPLTPADLNRSETIDVDRGSGNAIPFGFSPDGSLFVYSLRRSKESSKAQLARVLGYQDHLTNQRDRNDLWILDVATGAKTNITEGAKTDSGCTMPKWSPDGSRLAMVCFRPDGWYVDEWDRATNAGKQVVGWKDASPRDGFPEHLAWVSNTRVAVDVVASNFIQHGPWLTAAIAGMPNAVDHESPSRLSNRSELLIADVEKARVVGSWTDGNEINEIATSPRQHLMAISMTERDRGASYRDAVERDGVAIASYTTILDENGKVLGPLETGVSLESISRGPVWSPDGVFVAFSAQTSFGIPSTNSGFICTVPSLKCRTLGSSQLGQIQEMHWTADGSLLIASKAPADPATKRATLWWLVPPEGRPARVSKDSDFVPESLTDAGDRENFVGVREGRFWKWNAGTGKWTMSQQVVAKDARVVRPIGTHCVGCENPVVYLENGQGEAAKAYRLRLKENTIDLVGRPETNETLLDFAPQNGARIYVGDSAPNLHIPGRLSICGGRKSECETVVVVNDFLNRVGQSRHINFTYKTAEGQDVGGELTLPYGYKEGERYPMVVSLYAGQVEPAKIPNDDRYQEEALVVDYGGFDLLSAHGYAVLNPSMPLGREGLAGDPYAAMLNGVLPALDKAVALGVADPDRIGVIGASYGGYSVMSVIAQSSRFRAAVSISGLSDLISDYGTFNGNDRYDPYGSIPPTFSGIIEEGQGRMGLPPWRDPARYIRNSPLFFVEQVTTPILLIHGDVDSQVPVEQSEEFFTALARLNKRASYVQYIGEGHMFPERPENFEDAWSRIYAWFDSYLKGDDELQTSMPSQ